MRKKKMTPLEQGRAYIERRAKRQYAEVGGNPRGVAFKRVTQTIKRKGY